MKEQTNLKTQGKPPKDGGGGEIKILRFFFWPRRQIFLVAEQGKVKTNARRKRFERILEEDTILKKYTDIVNSNNRKHDGYS